jgi:hypothetical protein
MALARKIRAMESKTLPTEMEQHADENQDTICFD